MSFLSLIIVFLLEQLQPLSYRRFVAAPVAASADFVEARINVGSYRHGLLAWLLIVLPVVGLTLLIYLWLMEISALLGLVFNVVVLYLTMGFRQFSSHYTEIQLALRTGDLSKAREILAGWRGTEVGTPNSSEISRLAIEQALVGAHRHVFAVLLWFVVLPGPCGAVLYRLSAILVEHWRQAVGAESADFVKFSEQAFRVLDWLPVRATAAVFAAVGDFEDAVYCWRTQAGQWPDPETGIVLASAAGALGVQLGMPVVESGDINDRAELGVGSPADVEFMQSAVGLVWRATVFWILLLFLLGLSNLAGFTRSGLVSG